MIEKLKLKYSAFLKWKKQIKYDSFGDRNYKKFVIISTSRTGSTLLMTLLNDHENIICEGEIFKNLNNKSCEQIWNIFFANKPKKIEQVGFKLFYFHPNGEDKSVWDFIKNDKNITIIHLMRKNLLRIYLSQRIGLKTKLWTDNINRPNNITLESKKVTLNYQECSDALDKMANYQNKTKQIFKNHNYLEIFYEDLVQNKSLEMNRIFTLLNLPVQKVSANNKKQNPENLNELINNYSDLKIKFKNSEWEHLFED